MKDDERLKSIDKERKAQMNRLDVVLSDLVNNLREGRNNIFDITEDLQKQCLQLETEIERLNIVVKEMINKVENQEKLEKLARVRLMEVSRDFKAFSEQDIKEAYATAQSMQIELLNLRQEELYARKQREAMLIQLKQFRQLVVKADNFINNTGLALKILEGNVAKISESVEGALRKQAIEMWIVQSQESERKKIARELHDGPAQSLASMLIRLGLIERLGPQEMDRVYQELDNIKDICQESLGDIRRIMFDLRPTLVHDSGLANTLREYFNDYEAKYNFCIDFVTFGREKKYDLSLEIALFRLTQEAITNVRKHAGVNNARVKLEDSGKMLTVVIKDEGLGFDPEQITQDLQESYGILGMKERVQLLGGEIDIVSVLGEGTQVIIKVPVEGEDKKSGH